MPARWMACCNALASNAAGRDERWQSARSGPIPVGTPAEVKLEGNFARVQLVVTAADASGMVNERSEDLTGGAKFASSDEKIVSVNERGVLLAVADGQAKITITAGSLTKEVPVTVSGVVPQPAVGFTEQIRPILNKAGCAMAACHAAQHGKGGFKLSVFGFEPDQGPDGDGPRQRAAADGLCAAGKQPAAAQADDANAARRRPADWKRARSTIRCCSPG